MDQNGFFHGEDDSLNVNIIIIYGWDPAPYPENVSMESLGPLRDLTAEMLRPYVADNKDVNSDLVTTWATALFNCGRLHVEPAKYYLVLDNRTSLYRGYPQRGDYIDRSEDDSGDDPDDRGWSPPQESKH